MKLTYFLSSKTVKDFLKGLIVTVFGGVVAIVAPSIQDGSFIFNWTTIWHTAVASGLAYLGHVVIAPIPKTVQIDSSKTTVIDKNTKEIISDANITTEIPIENVTSENIIKKN